MIRNGEIALLPPSAPGMRIGLFGGSFNPPHDGHRLVALQCLKRLELDAVWMLVTPGNPLKDNAGLAGLAERVAAVAKLVAHPRVRVTAFEADHGFRYSYDTVRFLTTTLPDRRFVWIMGADNFRDFDRWERWRDIAGMMPMAIYNRPGASLTAPRSPAATALARYRVDEADARHLADLRPPAWVFLRGLLSGLSSRAIRAAAKPVAKP